MMTDLQFFNYKFAILDRYHNLVCIFQRKIIQQFFANINDTLAFASNMKTTSTSFLSHYYKIVLRYINNCVFIRNRKIYKELIPIHSYESHGKRDKK